MTYSTEAQFILKGQQPIAELKAIIAEMKETSKELVALGALFKTVGTDAAFFAKNVALAGKEMRAMLPATRAMRSAGNEAAVGFDRMASASGAAYGKLVQQNIQMHEMILTMKEMETVSRSAASATRSVGSVRRGGIRSAAGGAAGMAGAAVGGSMGGPMGAIMGAIDTAFIATMGFDVTKGIMRPAVEYEAQLSGLHAFGLNASQEKQADLMAKKTARDVPTTTPTENLQTFKEAYQVTKDFNNALKLMKDSAQFKVATASLFNTLPSLKGKSHGDFMQSVFKAGELLGTNDPELFRGYLNAMYKSTAISGTLTDPGKMAQQIKMEKSARMGKEEDWWPILTHIVEEGSIGKSGSGTGGNLIARMNAVFAGGTMNKRVMAGLAQIGAFEGQHGPNQMGIGAAASKFGFPLSTPASGATTQIKNLPLFIKNPMKWIWETIEPALLAKAMPGKSPQEALATFNKMSPNDPKKMAMLMQDPAIRALPINVQDIVTQAIMMRPQLEKQIKLYKQAHTMSEQYSYALGMTVTKAQAAHAAFETLQINFGQTLTPAVRELTDGMTWLTNGIGELSTHMPKSGKAVDDFNHKVFGAAGSFHKFGDAIERIQNLPLVKKIIEIADKTAAKTTDNAGNLLEAGADTAESLTDPKNKAKRRAALQSNIAYLKGVQGFGGQNQQLVGFALLGATEIGSALGNAHTHLNKQEKLDANELMRKAPTVGELLGRQVQVMINQVFHGHADPAHVKEATRQGVHEGMAKAMAKTALLHAGTTSKAGGNWNTAPLAGSP